MWRRCHLNLTLTNTLSGEGVFGVDFYVEDVP